jgi:hypothetical protein
MPRSPATTFFVSCQGTFSREVGEFKKGTKTPERRQLWVFGYIGTSGKPDEKRRGWVPYRVLQYVGPYTPPAPRGAQTRGSLTR